MSTLDPVQLNVAGVQSLVGSKLNKVPYGKDNGEGVQGELVDELTLDLSDDELLDLAKTWEGNYRGYEGKIKVRQEANKTYYLGAQLQGSGQAVGEVIAANMLFEAEETFLPAALAKNPEPVVFTDNTSEGTIIATAVKSMLQYHADQLVLRAKLTLMTRHWSVYFLGVIKHGWNSDIQDIESNVIDPQDLILDPEACIDSYGDYTGDYLGQRKKCTAKKLIEMFPKHKAYIIVKCDGRLGTTVQYTEWWSNTYCFYTFEKVVLDKSKNPHFNYDKEEKDTDIDGVEQVTKVKGNNHFAQPKMPYSFLSVFTFGKQPHDITSLIEQNIPNQNLVTKRTNQIDANLARANNSIGLSANNFNQETGKQAAQAMEKGNPVLIPGADISQAIARFPAPAYPDAAFKQLEISKQDLRSIFGTQGISSQEPNENTTARGMILNQQFDNSRIGGGISERIAQAADNIFNYWVQLYYVYYDQDHVASVMGKTKAVEYVTLKSQDLDRRIIVSVAPDSMKPKDEITQMNQAMSLFEKGALDPKTLLTMLNVPDPQKTAESTILWIMDKNAYLQLNFPELAQKLQGIQQQQMTQMGGQAVGGGGEQIQGGAPAQEDLAIDPASAALSNVQLPQ